MTSTVRLFAVVFSIAMLSLALVTAVGLLLLQTKSQQWHKTPGRGPVGRFLRAAAPLEVTIGAVVLTMGEGADGIGPIAIGVILLGAGGAVLIRRYRRGHDRAEGFNQ